MQYCIDDGVRHSTAAAYIAPGGGEREPRPRHRSSCAASALRRKPLRRSGVGAGGRLERARAGGGRRLRRDDRVGAAPPALGRRAGGPPALARDRRRRGPAGRRREPARPPALARDLQRRARGRTAFPRAARLPDPSFLALSTGARGPDIQPIHFMVPMYESWMDGPENGFTLMGGMVRPVSRGSLRLTGPAPEDPVPSTRTSSRCETDLESLAAAVDLCRRIGAADALRRVGRHRALPRARRVDSRDELRGYVREHRDHLPPPGRHLQDGHRRSRPSSTLRLRVHGDRAPARRRRVDHARP